MSSDSEDNFDELSSSGTQNRTVVLAALTNEVALPSPTRARLTDRPSLPQPSQVRSSRSSIVFKSHVCAESLKSFLSLDPNPRAKMLRRRLSTALGVYLTCAMNSRDRSIMERSIDVLLSCGTCMSQLCMITAARSEDPAEHVLYESNIHARLCNIACRSPFEALLFRAAMTSPPGFYGDMDCPAESPCVNLGLCRCAMRPLYAAIYFSNAQMMTTLLRYGAEVRPEDKCRCEELHPMHPLLRVYKTLSAIYWPPTGTTDRHAANRKSVDDDVRCHQLAALVMPCQDAELSDTCFSFARACTPSDEYETLLRVKGSLQHLCRLTIRAALAKRRAMPNGAEQLPLPKLLQRYILYQDGPGCV